MTELWEPIEGFLDYEVSNHGRVRNIYFERLLKLRNNSYGYMKVALREGGVTHEMLVHRLVAQAFLGVEDPSNVQIKHRDGDNGNNHVDNLKIKKINGTFERLTPPYFIPRRRIKIVETGEIFRSVTHLAGHLGCSPTSVYNVLKGKQQTVRDYRLVYHTEEMPEWVKRIR